MRQTNNNNSINCRTRSLRVDLGRHLGTRELVVFLYINSLFISLAGIIEYQWFLFIRQLGACHGI